MPTLTVICGCGALQACIILAEVVREYLEAKCGTVKGKWDMLTKMFQVPISMKGIANKTFDLIDLYISLDHLHFQMTSGDIKISMQVSGKATEHIQRYGCFDPG